MNSNFIVAGLIALIVYLLCIFALVAYFNIYKTTKTVGKKDSFDISIVSKEPPQPTQQERRQIQAQQETTPVEVHTPQQTEPTKPTSLAPRASIADIFESIKPSKTKQTTQEPMQYKSRYQSQKIQSRDEITIHSLKDATISSVQGGEIYDELVIEFQEFLHSKWNPPANVGLHESTLRVRVMRDGSLEFKVYTPSPSNSFNRYVQSYIEQVKFFKPIDRELYIELILKTKE